MNALARHIILLTMTCAVPACTGRAATDSQDFSRYKVIIDRAPFGATVSADAGPAVMPNFAARFTFVGLVKTETDGVLRAIVQDRDRNNRSYFVAENETIPNDTVKMLHIEHSPPKIVLQQGLETATLSYQAAGTVAAPPAPTAGGAPQPGQSTAPSLGRRRIPFQRGGG